MKAARGDFPTPEQPFCKYTNANFSGGINENPGIGSSLTAAAVLVPARMVSQAQETAETIYTAVPILTTDDARANTEAVAVKDGVILAGGTLADVIQHQGDGTEIFELDGRAILRVYGQPRPCRERWSATSIGKLAAPPGGDVTRIARLQETLLVCNFCRRRVVSGLNELDERGATSTKRSTISTGPEKLWSVLPQS